MSELNLSKIVGRVFRDLISTRISRSAIRLLDLFGIFRSNRRAFAFILVLGTLLRLGVVPLFPSSFPTSPSHLVSDSAFYDQSAMDGISGGAFSTYWSPGFSMFLAGFYSLLGHDLFGPLAVLSVLGGSIAAIAYFLSMKMYNDKKSAFLAALVVGTEPALVWESPQIMSDTLALFLFSLFVYVAVSDLRRPRLANISFAGVLAGLAVLTRPVFIAVALVYLVFIFASSANKHRLDISRLIKRVLLFCLSFMVIIGPWLAYTDSRLGEPVLTTNGGINFYIGNNPNATGRYCSVDSFDNMDEIEINSVGYERGLQYILDNPWNALMLDLKKSVLMFAAPQRLPSELLQHDRPIWQEYSFSIVINASFVVLESIGILWILSNRKKLDLSGRLLITCAALSYIVQIAFFVDARYAMPIVFVFSIFGAQFVISSAYEKTPQHASDRLPL